MIPTFTDIQELGQCEELRVYFNSLGASLVKPDEDGFYEDLKQIISVCDLCFKEEKDSDKQSVLNSIVSLLIQVPQTDSVCSELINAFCAKLVETANPSDGLISIKILQNLFEGTGANPSLNYDIYLSLVKIAGSIGHIDLVYEDLNKVRSMYNKESVGLDKVQKLLRLLHEVLSKENSHEASKVMIELLGTYTEATASQARSDAHRCIVSFLSDPKTFLMDHLLALKPVKFLEGESIHDLLLIFVSDKLTGYIKFYNSHKQLIENLGLSHEQNLHKMRLLTFMQIAENKKELSFQTIKEELQLKDEDVEAFVIDVLRTKLLKAKVDQVNKKVSVTSTIHRTFGRQQWQQLRDTLTQWQENLAHIHNTIGNAIYAQHEPMAPINANPIPS
ncbi:eukaryotic translation initiation factor 3 subunit M-like [Panonychus citri]|uniref:eukaryotic translation initiation factor 3 subunit M-like n=1 Tax=Panonychus citri TaxID=50023 RepID=UPI00230805F8|nr:eukaryotic translation initiation factor 3 subunit M-like [Panonychus citri]